MQKEPVVKKEEVKKKPTQEKIKELEAELSKTKYNKRTQFHIGLVKAKISKLKEKEASRGKGSGVGEGFAVRKTGDATAVLLGLTCIPGLLEYKHAKIQVLDVPGIVHGAASGRGRGKEVLQVIRNADMILIVLDVLHPEHYEAILREVYETGVRINQRKPDVKITKTARGGVRVGSTIPLTKIDVPTIQGMARELGINNGEILVRADITPEQFIDIVEGNKVYIPAITLLNKMDLVDEQTLFNIAESIHPDLMISAEQKKHLEELKDLIYERLQLIRIFLKEVNKKPDMDEPLIMRKGSTITDVCNKLHRDFVTKFKYARIWGKSAKFEGQQFRRLDHVLQEEDIVEIHLR
ncbi:TGS domain-containing protein [Candidatus Woesearchaeota archaeon]|nr:TGS domain-containing protein [Candidatus Woesearchaeota archaeon]